MFSFTCEICNTECKNVDEKYNIDAWQYHEPSEGHCYFCVDDMCEDCASKVRDFVDKLGESDE